MGLVGYQLDALQAVLSINLGAALRGKATDARCCSWSQRNFSKLRRHGDLMPCKDFQPANFLDHIGRMTRPVRTRFEGKKNAEKTFGMHMSRRASI